MPQKRGSKTLKKRVASSPAKKTKILTIPELRSSLDHITKYTETIVQSGNKSVKEVASVFAQEWKKTFGKTLKPSVAESYIRSMMKVKRSATTMKQTPGKTKGTRRKMRGGSVLTGAPLNYLTRPGVDLPYGNFERYVENGFFNPEPAILKDCGIQQGILPQAGMGSNKMNGGDLSAALMRPFVATNPFSIQHDASMNYKGQPMPPGPESWQQTWRPHMNPYSPALEMSTLAYTRDLTNDVTVPGAIRN